MPLLASAALAYALSGLLGLGTGATAGPTLRAVVLPQPTLAGAGRRTLTALHWASAGAVSAARGLNDTPKLAAVAGFAPRRSPARSPRPCSPAPCSPVGG